MANGNRIIVGITPGQFYLQPDSAFTENQWGFDSGERKWLTHPKTAKNVWPQRGQPDDQWRNMYLQDLIPREDASGLIELTGIFRGVMRFDTNGLMKERILPGAAISMFTLPALQSGSPVNVVAPVPKPQVTREYLTLTKPSLSGVSLAWSGTFLPQLPAFSISYVPNPDETPTVNYGSGWKLDDRTWEDIAGAVFLVRETGSFYYPIAV